MAPNEPPLASVDEIREELRRLGYFESGLDRFVLAGTTSRSLVAASLRAALRVGLIGGVIFGAVLSLAGLGLDPRFLASPQDLAVLTAYLVVVLGAAVGLAAFLGGLAAGFWARRRGQLAAPSLPRNVGLALALGGLTYFSLWWSSHALKAPAVFQVVAALLGLGLCLVLGRFGFLASVAVLSAAGLADRLPEAGLSRSRMLLLLGLAALLSGGGIVGLSASRARAGEAAPDFAVIPTGLRVVLLGVDGLEARMAEQMMAAGDMPHLRALMDAGARGRLVAEPEQVPAIVWTTIATGRGPEAHGIRSAGARRLAGMSGPLAVEEGRLVRALGTATDLLRLSRSQPPTSVLRSVKAFWNVASEKGLRVCVVNWWATWPADAVNGCLVTDRAYFKLEKGGEADREVHPPELFGRLKPLLKLPSPDDRPRRIDGFHWAAFRMLHGAEAFDLEAVYLPGLDIATMQQLGETGASDLATLDARLATVKEHYRFLDSLLGEALRARQPGEVLILVGDPGRLARQGGARPEGILVLAGDAVAPGEIGPVTEKDIAPTALHLLGLPVSQELEGRVVERPLSAAFRQKTPVRFVASYGRRHQAPPAESGFDREMMEQLRSLGYIR